MAGLSLKLEQYEGPLDLLLSLIQKHKIDIFDIPISELTDQYLEYLRSMEQYDMQISSDFILMASELMYIKSRLLLPVLPKDEDPRQPLVDALLEYSNRSPLNRMELKGSKTGVITASIAYQYAKDVFPEDTSFLKLGLTNPLPMELIREFASKVETLYVIEELEGFMEERIKAAGIDCIGKALVSNMYELNPQRLKEMLFGEKPVVRELPVTAGNAAAMAAFIADRLSAFSAFSCV